MAEPRDPLSGLAERHRRIAIDSNVLIYLLEDHPVLAEPAAALVDAVAERRLEGVMASLALSETLVGPARADDGARFELAAATIRDLGFEVVPLDADVAVEAAWIRGRTGATMPDAVHLASARAAGATAFVTNDRRLPGTDDLEIVVLAHLVPPA